MSGGPQVFLGATTFCLIATPPDLRPPRGAPVGIGLLGVPVGGGPPARRPRCELRSARRLEARPGPAAAHGHRSQAPQASQRPPIGRSDEHSPAPPQPTNSGIREVPTQFVWCRAQWRRQLNPAQKRIRTGPLLLALTRRRVSPLLGRRTCRSTPRRRWGGSNQAGWPGADST